MADNFNTYINHIEFDFWKKFCIEKGEFRLYSKGEEFVSFGTAGRYIGFVKTGTMKYVTFSADGTEHVIGLECAGEFVADFPFSLYGHKSRVSIIAESDCEIYCIPVALVKKLMDSDDKFRERVMHSSEAIFATLYDRYVELYTKSPQQRYNDLICRYPDLFALFSLKDIASFLNVTPTHLSRLRKNS